MHNKSLGVLAITIALTGCSIKQTVNPVESFTEKEICLIENPNVKAGFITSTYNATWRWDMALYMALADIKVYNNGKPIGEANYDSQSGGANMGKFINADKKIAELVNKLFPGGAGS
jgi:hypothetical protein